MEGGVASRLRDNRTWDRQTPNEHGGGVYMPHGVGKHGRRMVGRTERDSLLLEIILPRASRLTARERTPVVALAGVHARVASKVAPGGERAVALWAGEPTFSLGR